MGGFWCVSMTTVSNVNKQVLGSLLLLARQEGYAES